jgi:hypothetical protein
MVDIFPEFPDDAIPPCGVIIMVDIFPEFPDDAIPPGTEVIAIDKNLKDLRPFIGKTGKIVWIRIIYDSCDIRRYIYTVQFDNDQRVNCFDTRFKIKDVNQ